MIPAVDITRMSKEAEPVAAAPATPGDPRSLFEGLGLQNDSSLFTAVRVMNRSLEALGETGLDGSHYVRLERKRIMARLVHAAAAFATDPNDAQLLKATEAYLRNQHNDAEEMEALAEQLSEVAATLTRELSDGAERLRTPDFAF